MARRDGEASFVWVQDFDDAYRAAHVSRGVALLLPVAIYREWVAIGRAPEELLRGVQLSAEWSTGYNARSVPSTRASSAANLPTVNFA
jgi:hypothetical protein